MNELIIKLTGEIVSSNFPAWKDELICKIKSIKTDLITDNDFVDAIDNVKTFKVAETSLKQSKQTAIDQAKDIQSLFAAIDEVSEEVRQARLSLERQIKTRKIEIKQNIIQEGIKSVEAIIKSQSAIFQKLDHSKYISICRFEQAVKGKAGVKGIELAINKLSNDISKEIEQEALRVARNSDLIESLSNNHKILFQDRDSLLPLNESEFNLVIEKRIALFEVEQTKAKAEHAVNELKKTDEISLNPTIDNIEADREKYRIIIDIFSTKESAIEVAQSIKKSYGTNELVSSIRLLRNREK